MAESRGEQGQFIEWPQDGVDTGSLDDYEGGVSNADGVGEVVERQVVIAVSDRPDEVSQCLLRYLEGRRDGGKGVRGSEAPHITRMSLSIVLLKHHGWSVTHALLAISTLVTYNSLRFAPCSPEKRSMGEPRIYDRIGRVIDDAPAHLKSLCESKAAVMLLN